MPCRVHWLQLQQHQSELERLGVRVSVVTFDDEPTARAYVEENQLGWPLLIDAQRELYTQFGMGRASWWTLIKPSTIWSYLVLWRNGVKPQKVGSDMHQLGGDVLIDPNGMLRLNHVSTEPHDRPSIDSLLNLIRGEGE
jgi:alkyl hydroperoxide reductase subunit AhpC